MPAKLSVNLNAIAMLRNRRDLPWPSVTGLGRIALAAGAHGLTVHPQTRPAPHAPFGPAGHPGADRRRVSRRRVQHRRLSDRGLFAPCGREPAESGDAGARRSGAADLRPWLEFRGGCAVPDTCSQEAEEERFSRLAVFRSQSRWRRGGARDRSRPYRTLHRPVRVLPFRFSQGGRRTGKARRKRPMRRLPPASRSMPATTSPLQICRLSRKASLALPRCRSATA